MKQPLSSATKMMRLAHVKLSSPSNGATRLITSATTGTFALMTVLLATTTGSSSLRGRLIAGGPSLWFFGLKNAVTSAVPSSKNSAWAPEPPPAVARSSKKMGSEALIGLYFFGSPSATISRVGRSHPPGRVLTVAAPALSELCLPGISVREIRCVRGCFPTAPLVWPE